MGILPPITSHLEQPLRPELGEGEMAKWPSKLDFWPGISTKGWRELREFFFQLFTYGQCC